MLRIIDLLKTSVDDFKDMMLQKKYNSLIQRKMKIIIETALLGQIETKKIYILERIGDEPIEEELRKFAALIDMEWCELNRGGVFSQFHYSETIEKLRSLLPGETVMLREFVLTDYCGYAWVNCKHDVFIEAKKGGFYTYWECSDIPTHYIMDKDGITKFKNEKECTMYYDYDFGRRQWRKLVDEKSETVRLSEEERKAVFLILLEVNKTYHNVKVAWIKSKGRIVVFDIWLMVGQGVLE